MIYAIDPGKHGCGLAWGTQYQVFGAKYVPSGYSTWIHTDVDEVYLELMRWRRNSVPADDLIDVATQGGILAGRLGGKVTLVPPRDWKGTIDGDVMVKRIQKHLRPEEIARVELPIASLAHNVWDSVGIYLWSVGRL